MINDGLILNTSDLDRIRQRFKAYANDHTHEDPLVEQLATDVANLLADLETLRHRATQAELMLTGKAHPVAE